MKTLLISATVAVATLAGAASAMVPAASVAQIERVAPDADLSNLTDSELTAIVNAINSTDSVSDKRGTVMSLIRAYQ